MALTERRVARLKGRGRYSDGEVPGLYLQINDNGAKSWLLRWEPSPGPDGKRRQRYMGLGALHSTPLKLARERAKAARQKLFDGIDPLAARRAERATSALAAARALTFEAAATQYFDQHEKGWRNVKHRDQFLSTLRAYAFPIIGRLSIAAIDTGLVLRCIEPIWHDKTETANRVRGRIESVLDWATVRGYRTGENPARWKGHIGEVLPAREKIQRTKHHAALPWAALPEFLAALQTRAGIAARALEFTILTAARTGEVVGATWDEIDLKEKIWTIPAGRMKASKEHRVPLSDRVLDILRALPTEKGNPFAFIGPRQGGLSSAAMGAVIKRMERDDFTVHGMRSTFMDWAHEQTAYPKVVIDMALAHAVGDKVEAAYRRGDLFEKRRKLMAAWAQFCETKPAADNVIGLRVSR